MLLLIPLVVLLVYPNLSAAIEPGGPLTAPPEPAVRPEIPVLNEMDKDRNRIDDEIDAGVRHIKASLARESDASKRAILEAKLKSRTRMEFVFSQRITQKQIDDFRTLGGHIDHIYKAVSYGWNGSLPFGQVEKFRDAMGESLVGIVGEKTARATMDEAGRTGRVRPVWAPGFAGNASGFTGNSTTTICIMDTGVDDSHPDLAGRQEFWTDYTGEGLASPADVNGHGSHVAGIALGTGAAAGAGSGTLFYTDSGNMSGLAKNYFYPSPVHIPNSVSTTLTSTAYWTSSSNTSLYGLLQADGSTGSYSALSSATSGSSPLTEANSFSASPTNHYSAGLVQGTPPNISTYAVANSITNYPAVGDGFNKFSGVAPGSRWAGSRVLSANGSGSSLNINIALDEAVAQRISHNIKVLNMSLGLDGNPGIDTSQRAKVNTLVNNGIVAVVAAGNDGPGTGGANIIDDPGRAALAITVAASNDINQLTRYSSSGFASPSSSEDFKPDLMAPGGSDYYSMILSVDSNDADAENAAFSDKQANDYANISGTSMATPFVAGAAALVIQALESQGLSWSFTGNSHPLLVKMLLCATSTESNAPREVSSGTNPTLGRAASPKDLYEGYGILNVDAAVEAVALSYTGGSLGDSTAGGFFDRRAWARKVVLIAGGQISVNLAVPATGDFDLYLYSGAPESKGNPVIISSSTNAGVGIAESINYTSVPGETVHMVIKRVSGGGAWSLSGSVSGASDTIPPTINSVVVSPPMAAAGDSIHVAVNATDNIAVTNVSANGTLLTPGGGNDWTGDITANSVLGTHTVAVLAEDSANNTATDSSQSYKTVSILYMNSGELAALEFPFIVSSYLLATFGKVTRIDDDTVDIDHGTGPVRVFAANHGLQTGDYAYARGIWQTSVTPHILLSSSAHCVRLF